MTDCQDLHTDHSAYLADLRAWLDTTRDEPLEEMSAFFAARLAGYEEHMQHWRDAYPALAALVPATARTVLDLGCGTGLELDALLPARPDLRVTAIDVSPAMLGQLRRKHPRVEAICADYFTVELGEGRFDAAISFETLHHFTPERKAALYARVRRALKPGGVYVQGEYVACCAEEEELLQAELARRLARESAPKGFVHFDTPLTLERELALLRGAGFRRVDSPGSVSGACLIRAMA